MGFLSDLAGITPIGIATNMMGGDAADIFTGGAVSNAKSVSETNAAQMQLADKQMAFQERMSSSAYQRAMTDMRAAGLNPMLAMNNGGASTPSGAMATLTAPRKGDIGAGLANTAKQIATGLPEIQNIKSQAELNTANARVAEVTQDKVTANARESEANTHYTQQLNNKAKADTRTAKAKAAMAEMEKSVTEKRIDTDKKLAPADAWLERLQGVIGSITTAYDSFRRGPSRRTLNPKYEPTYDQLERAGRSGIPLP